MRSSGQRNSQLRTKRTRFLSVALASLVQFELRSLACAHPFVCPPFPYQDLASTAAAAQPLPRPLLSTAGAYEDESPAPLRVASSQPVMLAADEREPEAHEGSAAADRDYAQWQEPQPRQRSAWAEPDEELSTAAEARHRRADTAGSRRSSRSSAAAEPVPVAPWAARGEDDNEPPMPPGWEVGLTGDGQVYCERAALRALLCLHASSRCPFVSIRLQYRHARELVGPPGGHVSTVARRLCLRFGEAAAFCAQGA